MRAGEIGAINITVLPNGQTRAQARMRDEVGALVRLSAVRATEADARKAAEDQADVIRFGSAGGARLSAARKARSVFSQICATGIEHGVLAFNPVRDVPSLPLPAARGFTDADDIAAVLHARLARATLKPAAGRNTSRMIAGLIPAAAGPMSSEMRRALDERRDLIEQRSLALVDAALSSREAWIQRPGGGRATGRKRMCGGTRHASSPPTATGTASGQTQRWDVPPRPRPSESIKLVHELL
jgi:hypothetical protein